MSKFLKNINKITTQYVIKVIIFAIVLALTMESVALFLITRRSSTRTMKVLADQVSIILQNNEAEETEMVESLKEEYIVRAKAVARFLEYNPEAEESVEELLELASLLEIDEIHIFDETGTIVKGTEPKYYGLNFSSGEQMSYFTPMLDDKTLTMCQDVTPNTAENKEIMYAITWNEAGTEMIQVGITPTRLLDQLQSNDVTNVVSNMPEYESYDIYVADLATGEIIAATDKNAIGEYTNKVTAGRHYKCNCGDEYRIIITHATQADFIRNCMIVFITLFFLAFAGLIIYLTIRKLMASNQEKEEQLSTLQSMADIYYSMHLINLKEDTRIAYKATDEVAEIAKEVFGANQQIVDVMKVLCKEDYLNAVLAFVDLKTLPERMRNRKMISYQFVGKRTGWTEASFIRLKANRDGTPVEVMFVTRSIEEAKRKEEALVKTSNTDELTKLLNRRAYEAKMNDPDLDYTDLVYVAFDVNGLKRINDSLGHAAGDELIIGAADCITKAFGEYGNVYRIGGDEYVAVIHATEQELEGIKRAFDLIVAGWSGKLIDKLSISKGFVKAAEFEGDVKAMAILADKRMYEDKSAYYRSEGVDRRGHR